ncbi:ankyrin repeat-containing domain protein [Mycena amicta]|nr:ankyrin repeat-containing domain protein [Mycena amicta]
MELVVPDQHHPSRTHPLHRRHPPALPLNALTQTCTHLHSILQPVLDELLRDPKVANEILLKAARLGKSDVVSKLLAPPFSADPNTADSEGRTPLHAAAIGGHDFTVEALLRAGADVGRSYREYNYDSMGNRDIQPLHRAVVGGNVETARLLLQHGAEVKDWYLTEALAEEDIDMAKLLLDNGADSNNADLDRAVQIRNFPIMELLLQEGVMVCSDDVPTDVIWPPADGNEEILTMYLSHGVRIKDVCGIARANAKQWAEDEGTTEDELLEKVWAYFDRIDVW